jgi:hypothetical protein
LRKAELTVDFFTAVLDSWKGSAYSVICGAMQSEGFEGAWGVTWRAAQGRARRGNILLQIGEPQGNDNRELPTR